MIPKISYRSIKNISDIKIKNIYLKRYNLKNNKLFKIKQIQILFSYNLK